MGELEQKLLNDLKDKSIRAMRALTDLCSKRTGFFFDASAIAGKSKDNNNSSEANTIINPHEIPHLLRDHIFEGGVITIIAGIGEDTIKAQNSPHHKDYNCSLINLYAINKDYKKD